jgi:MFS family permease
MHCGSTCFRSFVNKALLITQNKIPTHTATLRKFAPQMAITTFKAFSSRNYRLYFTGQSVSLIGTWMQRTAVSWVIYTMTHSAFMLGVTIFCTQFPSFLLSLFGGVISDRYDRYKVLLLTQALSLVQAVLLALLILFKLGNVWEILTLGALLGIINAFDVPARQSLVHEMVSNKDDLPNALALNSSMVNLARLIGPIVSGLVLKHFGAGICFVVNAASFVAVISSLMMMRLSPHTPHTSKKKVLADMAEGFIYLRRTPTIGFVILMLASVSLFVLPYNTLLPIYAKVIFHGDAATFGYINGAIGAGAVCGAIFLASLKPGRDLKIILLVNTLIFGTGLILFSHMANYWLALLCALITGFGMMSQTTLINTIIQTTVNQRMRGRVISYFAMSFFGMMPLGALLVGAVSSRIGAPDTIMAQGIIAIIIAAAFSPFLRKDYLLKKQKEEIEEETDDVMEVL